VLSGFIILSAHAKDNGRPGSWTTYVWRRIARVYPVYWIYMATFCLLLALDLGQVARRPREAAAWLSTFSLTRFSPDSPPLQVAWTLFHEVASIRSFPF
jgi:exopolysaccharide production protein ExoZ